MPSQLTFLFVGSLATLATGGYFLEGRLPSAKRALFGLTAAYLWAIWAFEANEVYVPQLAESPLSIRPLWFTGLGFSFIMLALGLYRAYTVLTEPTNGGR